MFRKRILLGAAITAGLMFGAGQTAQAQERCRDCEPLSGYQAAKLIKPMSIRVCYGLGDCYAAKVPLMSRCARTRYTRTCPVRYLFTDGVVCTQRIRAKVTYTRFYPTAPPPRPRAEVGDVSVDNSELVEALREPMWDRTTSAASVGKTICRR